jgi:phage-related minor tail protein
MPLPQSSSDPPPDRNGEALSEAQTFEQELADVERSLQALKERYVQVQQDEQARATLEGRKDDVKRQLQRSPSPALKAELTSLQSQLDALEVNLESRLFSWGSLREPFWQIVRFGGLGVVIGWSIAIAVLQNPAPTPQPSISATQTPQQ